MRTVEDEAVIDHEADEGSALGSRFDARAGEAGAVEDGLARIGVPHPLVEDEDAAEIGEVGYLGEQNVGKEVVNRERVRVAWEAGAEMPAGGDGLAALSELKVNLGIGGEEFFGELDYGDFGRRNAKVSEEDGGDIFVDEDAPVLGIIEELDDVRAAILGFEHVGLRATTHFSEETAGAERHGGVRAVPLSVAIRRVKGLLALGCDRFYSC
jgi:hypothetical protein